VLEGMASMEERDGTIRLIGLGALLAGAVSAAVVAVDGSGQLGGAFARDQVTIYGPAQAALAIALAVGGILLLVVRRRAHVSALLGVTGLCAAQLAGAGFVGYRRWPLYWGCCSSGPVTEPDLVHRLAMAMGVVCAVTAVACVVILAWKGFLRWHGLAVAVAIPVALVVAVAVPRLVAGGWGDKRELAAWALIYSLPYASGLAVSAFMERFAALAVVGAVSCSALIARVGEPFLGQHRPWGDALSLVLLAAAAVAVSRLIPQGRRAPQPRVPQLAEHSSSSP
jgi:hypothetical protein